MVTVTCLAGTDEDASHDLKRVQQTTEKPAPYTPQPTPTEKRSDQYVDEYEETEERIELDPGHAEPQRHKPQLQDEYHEEKTIEYLDEPKTNEAGTLDQNPANVEIEKDKNEAFKDYSHHIDNTQTTIPNTDYNHETGAESQKYHRQPVKEAPTYSDEPGYETHHDQSKTNHLPVRTRKDGYSYKHEKRPSYEAYEAPQTSHYYPEDDKEYHVSQQEQTIPNVQEETVKESNPSADDYEEYKNYHPGKENEHYTKRIILPQIAEQNSHSYHQENYHNQDFKEHSYPVNENPSALKYEYEGDSSRGNKLEYSKTSDNYPVQAPVSHPYVRVVEEPHQSIPVRAIEKAVLELNADVYKQLIEDKSPGRRIVAIPINQLHNDPSDRAKSTLHSNSGKPHGILHIPLDGESQSTIDLKNLPLVLQIPHDRNANYHRPQAIYQEHLSQDKHPSVYADGSQIPVVSITKSSGQLNKNKEYAKSKWIPMSPSWSNQAQRKSSHGNNSPIRESPKLVIHRVANEKVQQTLHSENSEPVADLRKHLGASASNVSSRTKIMKSKMYTLKASPTIRNTKDSRYKPEQRMHSLTRS
ncbi:uncharacterized protein CEXT_487271 [Caerostris extrusa]|uniref:Uncharacterized protein n=1 Tax=Caerostris extrusa TaxID=172846 RepID=A0AAV4T9A9_CAEEX|nr:uncharacterized protein CEXT_487271 [Caerostris extrusa]